MLVDRREFLRTGAAVTAGAVLFGLGEIAHAAPAKSRVVDVRSPKWWRDDPGAVDLGAVREMLDEGMRKLTGKPTAAEAWKVYVGTKDVVGIKFNGLSQNHTGANSAIRDAIAAGLEAAGVKRENIVVAEHQDLGTSADLTREPEVKFDHGKTQLTRFIVKQVDVLIDVPDMKTHGGPGVTGALKNLSHAHTIMTGPGGFHANGCDPYIAEINALPPIRTKFRLAIMNGLKGVFDRWPGTRSPQFQWRHDGFLLSADPVAMDRVELEIIDEERKRRGLSPIGARARFLETAAKLDLGRNDLRQIEWLKLT
jgi:hypothetical protein